MDLTPSVKLTLRGAECVCVCSCPDIHYKVDLKLFKEVAKEIDPVLNS